MMDNPKIQWTIKILTELGYRLETSVPEMIQDNPWAKVCRFQTDRGYIFFKEVPPALSMEAKVIKILHDDFTAAVPVIIADNQRRHCFLMADAGVPLYQYFQKHFYPDIFIQAMHDYIALQMTASDKIDVFLEIGVPDWRLNKLSTLYQDLIDQEKWLLDDGLTKEELGKLKSLTPRLVSLCDELAQYKITETFGHGDFHDKNILIDISTGKTTIIDLGEVVITHPFFSFHNCLHRAKQNFSIADNQYQQLQAECLKPWIAFETHDHLQEILSIIQQCWPIHSVLAEFRLLNIVNQTAFQVLRRQGRLANNLRHWLRLQQ